MCAMSSVSCMSWVSHDSLPRNPCWLWKRMLWLSRWSMMLLTIMCFITLQEIQVRETVGSWRESTLNFY